MSELNETPSANRVRIAFFGLRNAGKSTLVNAFCGQEVSIVNGTPGTTTDPVSKAMEILPLGPCLITDTAGLDDEGELGEQRVAKTLAVLDATDVAVWVGDGFDRWRDRFRVPVIEFARGDSVEALKAKIAAIRLDEQAPGLLDGLVARGDRVVCVCPIDSSAPKGRLILPQVQLLRACLDLGAVALVCQPDELAGVLAATPAVALVVTDSQAFGKVRDIVAASALPSVRLTSFSILFARQKGDLEEFKNGLGAIRALKEGDTVIISEACTHRRQCEDIGAVKIPKAVMKLSGRSNLNFIFSSGATFNPDTMRSLGTHAALIVHCGGCMLTRRQLLDRIAKAKAAHVPIVNYGIVLAAASGIGVEGVCAI